MKWKPRYDQLFDVGALAGVLQIHSDEHPLGIEIQYHTIGNLVGIHRGPL